MVAAALCIPCMTAAASAGPGAPVVLGASAIGAAGYYTYRKSKKKHHKKKKKPTKKKKKKTKQRGGGISLKKDMKQIHKDHMECFSKCYKVRDNKFKRPFGTSYNDWFKSLSPEEKKIYNALHRKGVECSKSCRKIESQQHKDHKKIYSKEYKELNKQNTKKCCKCHYVKKKKSIRRVKGPWPHCSYDSNNCCKDKKNIIKSKN